MKRYSFPKEKIRILLLEKVHPSAEETFRKAGYSDITSFDSAPSGEELVKMLRDVHVVGVRSRTLLGKEQLSAASRLLTVGCYSVGTDQVELSAARCLGIPVFNAPFSSTRSVAELTLANIFALARKVAEQSAKLHQGSWRKSALGSYEVRGKTLGVVGYGHIGQQVALLAEAVGMDVVYSDVVRKLPFGRARAVGFDDLLKCADFVTVHVPGGPSTRHLLGRRELLLMKKGSYLLNLSRGTVVDLSAIREMLEQKHLAGAAVDVYPEEPAGNTENFESELCSFSNVVMTPHIGGSTEEAQESIGREVSEALVEFLDKGSTSGSVNFPSVHLPAFPNSHRILNVHQNVPGALSAINKAIFEVGANIDAQYLSTHEDIGFLIVDINREVSEEVKERLSKLEQSIRTRILY